ncbi:MAG: GIY-YIG nuclease family protein [Patescibacteria group bacterium]
MGIAKSTARYKYIERLYRELRTSKKVLFPKMGYQVYAPSKKGVYIIYNKNNEVVHVGCTPRAKNGIKQRLCNHLQGKSSFVAQFLKRNGAKLRCGYSFRCLIVDDSCDRKYLEALTIGKLCPKHIGKG